MNKQLIEVCQIAMTELNIREYHLVKLQLESMIPRENCDKTAIAANHEFRECEHEIELIKHKKEKIIAVLDILNREPIGNMNDSEWYVNNILRAEFEPSISGSACAPSKIEKYEINRNTVKTEVKFYCNNCDNELKSKDGGLLAEDAKCKVCGGRINENI